MELTAIGRMEAWPGSDPGQTSARQDRGRLIIAEEYAAGLPGLADCEYVQVILGPDQPREYALEPLTEAGQMTGILAARRPWRPSGLESATLRLLAVAGNVLTVAGAAVKPGRPVYDLRPMGPVPDAARLRLEAQARLRLNPRQDFVDALSAADRTRLLIKAAEIHGHFCPGVALGVMASIRGLRGLGVASQTFDGIMEDLLALVEINACFADGVQAVSGCTLGNNALVFRDLGRTAVTFVRRDQDKGLRVRVKPEFRNHVERLAPEFYPLVEKVIVRRQGEAEEMAYFKSQARQAAFGLIELDFEELFDTQWVEPLLPGYAPISPLVLCPRCQETVLAGKTVREGDQAGVCLACADKPVLQVDGRGIVRS